MSPQKIIISRTDNLGDVVLTLPMAGLLKKKFPNCHIAFLGKKYTKSLVQTCTHIDEFFDVGEMECWDPQHLKTFDTIIHVFPNKSVAQYFSKLKTPARIGTSCRWYHWILCNRRVKLSRKNSDIHECLLNLRLLQPLINVPPLSLGDIPSLYGFQNNKPLSQKFLLLLNKNKFNLVIHPKSHGSAREWPLSHYGALIEKLGADNFQFIVTGMPGEKEQIAREILVKYPHVIDAVGLFQLEELISFLNAADGIVCASTGPLHIASALGKHALGLFPARRNLDPARWGAVGIAAENMTSQDEMPCQRNCPPCACMEKLSPSRVAEKILRWKK